MKITRSEDKSVCVYSDIEICDVFEYATNLYMKIGPINSEKVNAICLINGHGVWFYDNEKVKRLNAELVIRDFNED